MSTNTPRLPSGPLRIAMIGTRGVPAAYGGFETAVEEIGRRLVDRGNEVTVYCRRGNAPGSEYLGMRLVHLPSLRLKTLETLSHTALSVAHATFSPRYDAAFVFNAANAPFVPGLRLRSIPVAVHVDGLEWQRGKWGKWGKRYYRFAETAAVRSADALIADAQGIADYYAREYGIGTELLSYGAQIQAAPLAHRLHEVGLNPGGYHLVVARFEPENHVDMIVRGYHESSAALPLVVVGSSPYSAAYTDEIYAIAEMDIRTRMLGGVWDQELLDQLYANALTYVHGHSVGGTNPSLLRAMGAGTSVIAFDVNFNREVLGGDGRFFTNDAEAGELIHRAENAIPETVRIGDALRERAATYYSWDEVALGYESLANRLANGYSTRGQVRRRRGESGATSSPATPRKRAVVE